MRARNWKFNRLPVSLGLLQLLVVDELHIHDRLGCLLVTVLLHIILVLYAEYGICAIYELQYVYSFCVFIYSNIS